MFGRLWCALFGHKLSSYTPNIAWCERCNALIERGFTGK